MRACTFDYAIVRVVPRVERAEFVNVGVIVFCSEQAFLDACLETSLERLRAFAPALDCAEIEEHLSVIARVCCATNAGPIGALSQRERWHWLVAPRSTLIQTSPVHCGLCENPQLELEKLFHKMVR